MSYINTAVKAFEVLKKAQQAGVIVFLENGKIKVKTARNNSIPGTLLEDIKLFRADIETILLNKAESQSGENDIFIPKNQPRPQRIPLSFSQERLWFIDKLEGSIQYHMPAVVRLKGPLNIDALEFALRTIVQRHEILRTLIREEEGCPFQYISKSTDWNLTKIDGAGFANDTEKLSKFIDNLLYSPFDLANSPVFRGSIVKLKDQESILVLVIHHIAADGWSISVIVKELVELYSAFAENKLPIVPELPFQYADYAIWQRNYFQGTMLQSGLIYWKKQLNGTPTLNLLTDYPRHTISRKGAIKSVHIEKELKDNLTALNNREGSTMFMTLLSAFEILLAKYSGQNDICVGSVIANRDFKDLENLIGFFVNTLALRTIVNDENSFVEFLQVVKNTTLEAYEHQYVPFDKVVDEVVVGRDENRHPLFQVIFTLQNAPSAANLSLGEVSFQEEAIQDLTSKFDLVFSMSEYEGGIHLSVQYCTDLFKEETIDRMCNHFIQLLKSILISYNDPIYKLNILTPLEQSILADHYRKKTLQENTYKNVVEIFESQVTNSPAAIALKHQGQSFTYSELNKRSNQLARYLVDAGITTGSLVGICAERSFELIVGLIAIIKAGGAYVPIDTKYPIDRINYMIDDSKIQFLLTTGTVELNKAGTSLKMVNLDTIFKFIAGYNEENLGLEIFQDQLINVIYTSGSTGKPKGVMIAHGNMVNLIEWHKDVFNLSKDTRSTCMAGVAFDALGWEIWPYLSSGSTIIIVDDEVRVSVDKLIALFNENEISHSFITTSLIYEFISRKGQPITLRYLLTGGEKLLTVDITDLHYSVVNNYGPTENTVVTTSYTLNNESKYQVPPIGKPIRNVDIFIIDKNFSLLPVGVVGEICIGGIGLSKGYYNQPSTTAGKFMINPVHGTQFHQIYRSGDLGRLMPDGNIEYLGRVDDQIKIRGHRIEPGEIEQTMQNSGLVTQNIIIPKPDGNTNKLVSYLVPNYRSIKDKESELCQQQLDNWKELYNAEYSKTEETPGQEAEFNIVGWKDSFTGLPIPQEEMVEWQNDIVSLILLEKPGTVLEIGCGTGLIYYKIAPHIKKYIGTDFSKSCVEQIYSRVNNAAGRYPVTNLKVCPAHLIEIDSDENIDTVIINSVIQYFPTESYLSDVIARAINCLKGKGRIVIGDVRDYRLLKSFACRVVLAQPDELDPDNFLWKVDNAYSNDEELCVSPDYFYNLTASFPLIDHVEVLWKQGESENELSLYRYNVIISVNNDVKILKPEWKTWKSVNDVESIVHSISSNVDTIAVKDIPNPRLTKDRLLLDRLNDKFTSNASDMKTFIRKTDPESAAINKMILFSRSMGYSHRFLLDEDPFRMNLILEKNRTAAYVEYVFGETVNQSTPTSNMPLFFNISALIQKEVRDYLSERLPNYMVPSEFNIIQKMPLTKNGKVDRDFLRKCRPANNKNILEYVPPSNDMENIVMDIWKDLLGMNLVSTRDNFFEIGGHSLLAARLISVINEKLNLDLHLKFVFEHQVLEDQANLLTIYKSQHHETPGGNKNSHLIPLNTNSEKPAIFVIPGIFGVSDRYVELAKGLGNDYTVYGIQMMGIFENEEPLETIAQIAEQNINWLKEIQPQGPYIFIGHSFGGHVVFEMAKDLEMRGEKVDHIFLLDVATSFSRSKEENRVETLKSFLDEYAKSLTKHLSNREIEDTIAKILKIESQSDNLTTLLNGIELFFDSTKNYTQKEIQMVKAIVKIHYTNSLINSEIEGMIEAPVTVIKASDEDWGHHDKYLGWSRHSLTAGVLQTAGNHFSMLEKTNAKELARKIAEQMDYTLKI